LARWRMSLMCRGPLAAMSREREKSVALVKSTRPSDHAAGEIYAHGFPMNFCQSPEQVGNLRYDFVNGRGMSRVWPQADTTTMPRHLLQRRGCAQHCRRLQGCN
jgi:hypothetical protein